jgi:hypothetical protein
MAQGLNYDDSQIGNLIQQSISLNSNNTFLVQGIRFQGVWTLPVCDVGSYGDWVADPSSDLMPCCCGFDCSETLQFWNATGVTKLQPMHDRCATQCSTCPKSGVSVRFLIIGMKIVKGVWALVLVYAVGFICFNI